MKSANSHLGNSHARPHDTSSNSPQVDIEQTNKIWLELYCLSRNGTTASVKAPDYVVYTVTLLIPKSNTVWPSNHIKLSLGAVRPVNSSISTAYICTVLRTFWATNQLDEITDRLLEIILTQKLEGGVLEYLFIISNSRLTSDYPVVTRSTSLNLAWSMMGWYMCW